MKVARLPKLQRNKYRGKEVGSWLIEHKGEKINLRTKDAEEARRRRLRAMSGERKFTSDSAEGTAAEVAAAVDGASTGAAQAAPAVETVPAAPPAAPTPAPAGDAGTVAAVVNAAGAPPAATAAPAPAPAAPPGPVAGPELVDVVAAAAGPAAGDVIAGPVVPEKIDGELLTAMLEQAADALVVLQLTLQKWVIRLAVKVEASQVQSTNKALVDGRRLHALWMRAMLPPDLFMPAWAAPLVCVALGTLPEQLKDAKPIEPKEGDEPSSSSSSTPAAAA